MDSIAPADPGPNAFAVDAYNASKLLQKPCVSASDGVCKKPDVSSGAYLIGLSRQQLETIKQCATNKPWATVLHVGKLKVASLSSSLRTIQCWAAIRKQLLASDQCKSCCSIHMLNVWHRLSRKSGCSNCVIEHLMVGCAPTMYGLSATLPSVQLLLVIHPPSNPEVPRESLQLAKLNKCLEYIQVLGMQNQHQNHKKQNQPNLQYQKTKNFCHAA